MQFEVRPPSSASYASAKRITLTRLSRAVGKATDDTAREARNDMKTAMLNTGLGKLSRAIRYTSDKAKGRIPDINSNTNRWRAGATVFATNGSDRTEGALQSYTNSTTTIVPRRGRWLAIATDEIPKRVGRYRMTPELYVSSGLDRRIGELEFIPSKRPNEALLIARNVSVNGARGFGQARRIPRHGRTPGGRKRVDFVVAFILIRITRRAERFNPGAIFKGQFLKLPDRIKSNLIGSGQSGAVGGPIIASSGGSFTQGG